MELNNMIPSFILLYEASNSTNILSYNVQYYSISFHTPTINTMVKRFTKFDTFGHIRLPNLFYSSFI